MRKGQTLDERGFWSAVLPTPEHTQPLVWLTLSPAVQLHWNKRELQSRAGRAVSLDQLVSLTLWQGSQAEETLWVSWCGMGKKDEGGEGGEKNRDTEHSCFLFSQKLSFCVPGPHVCCEVFIFFLFFQLWDWCVAVLLSVCFGC